jgi:hypothetical protein
MVLLTCVIGSSLVQMPMLVELAILAVLVVAEILLLEVPMDIHSL